MEKWDILKHVIMPVVIIGLHWEIYKIKTNPNYVKDILDPNGQVDKWLMVLWILTTLIANLRILGILNI